jgi:hypothetical protein
MPALLNLDAPPRPPGSSPDQPAPHRWRVLIAVPPSGFDEQLAIMRPWLDQLCGRAGWHAAPAGFAGIVNDAVAFYFADRAAARAFVQRFACGYRMPGADRL